MSKRRKGWLAALLSLFMPGLGHIYCGKVIKALILYIGAIIVLNIALAILIFYDSNPANVIIPPALVILYYLSVIINARNTAAGISTGIKTAWYNRSYVYLGIFLVGGVLASYLTPVFGDYKSFKIPTPSMEDGLMAGDYLLADYNAYNDQKPEINDIIVFLWPADTTTFQCKRCVAGPGDVVEGADKVLYINGIANNTPATVKHTDDKILDRDENNPNTRDNFGPFEVPENSYFVMGDNRDNSYDSRFWGPVSENLILGKALRIYWSSDFGRIGQTIK